MTETAFYNLYW